jgi:hypothetical protein
LGVFHLLVEEEAIYNGRVHYWVRLTNKKTMCTLVAMTSAMDYKGE